MLSGGSYLSQSDLRVHFALGSHERLDAARITWPSGTIETVTNLAVDRFCKMKEGQGIISSERLHPQRFPRLTAGFAIACALRSIGLSRDAVCFTEINIEVPPSARG
jgi:hypothetical protein